jgi:acyl-CoA synthetase (AMP-forming)/AMP-acid ligase II
MFDAYYKNPEATRQTQRGEWYSVGDVARVDEDGYYTLCDRKRDMIISGRVNIYPAESEDTLHRHPAVEDVAVFGVPDDDWGERVHAAVQLRPAHTLTADELRAFARRHMADDKVPRDVSFPADFPRHRRQAHQASAARPVLGGTRAEDLSALRIASAGGH